MAQGNIIGKKGGGLNINGIIEQYKVASGGNVSAGDFVKFMEHYTTGETYLTSNSTIRISIAMLTNTKVFIAYSYTGSYYLYGMVCTIDNDTIKIENQKRLTTGNYDALDVSVVALNENKVFITAAKGVSYYKLYGMVCTINGTTITPGTNTQLSSLTDSGSILSIVALNENKVFITYSPKEDDTYNLYGMICTINGTSISLTTNKLVKKSAVSSEKGIIKLEQSKFFITYRDYVTDMIYGAICAIDNNTITITSTISITEGLSPKLVLIDTNKIFVTYKQWDNKAYGIVVNTDGTKSTKILLNTLNDIKDISMQHLKDNKIIIFLGYIITDSDNLFRATILELICSIDNNNITIDKSKELYRVYMSTDFNNTQSLETALLDEDSVLIFHNYLPSPKHHWLISEILKIETVIKQVQVLTDKISGIAKTSGTAEQTIEIYTPEEVEV